MKKILFVTVSVLALGCTPVFAHHGGGHHRARTVNYQRCNYADCNLDYRHSHDDGNYYYGHYYGDGHTYHNSNCGSGYCH